MATPFSVKGHSAIVTGAGSGINLEFAALLLSKGCNVLVADLNLRPEAEKLYSGFAKGSPRAIFLKTDVTNWGDLSRAFDTADTEFGDIDLVCPGAGIFEPHSSSFWHPPGVPGSKSVDSVDGNGHYKSLDINLVHPIRMTQLAVSYFLNPTKGRTKASPSNPKRVVHIASIASELALLSIPLYCSSKWAISGFVRSLAALEEAYGIRVAAVAPGIVKTPIWTDQPDKLAYVDEATDKWVTTAEVAAAMLKIAEDPAIPGGTVLEVGFNHTRDIPLFGNTGPQGEGHSVTNVGQGYAEVFGLLNADGWGVVPRK